MGREKGKPRRRGKERGLEQDHVSSAEFYTFKICIVYLYPESVCIFSYFLGGEREFTICPTTS